MPASNTEWTVEQLHELPDDGNRYEIVDGVLLVSPGPSWLHQRVIGELYLLLKPYADSQGLDVLLAPAAVQWARSTELQPDLLAVPLVNGRRADRFEDVRVLELAVEVLSPSSLLTDRFTKRRIYQRRGVSEYWIADPGSRSIERWRPNDNEPEIVLDTLVWQPRPESVPLRIDAARLFRAAHGEQVGEAPASAAS